MTTTSTGITVTGSGTAEGAGGGVPGGPRPMLARAMAEDSLAFDAGEQEISVWVTIRWALA